MAFRIAFVVCSLIAAAHAGFTFAGFDENGRAVSGIFPGVSTGSFKPPALPKAPPFLQLPGFPGFSNFPNFPQIQMPTFHFPEIHIPSPDEIVNVKPQPGSTFHGIAVTSNGQGTTVVTNKDGKVDAFQVGGSDEQKETSENEVPPKTKSTKRKAHAKNFEIPKIKPIKVLTPDEIKERKPKNNEHFVGYSKSTFSSSSTVNGKTKVAGGSESIVNDNGNVEQESVRIGEEDKE